MKKFKKPYRLLLTRDYQDKRVNPLYRFSNYPLKLFLDIVPSSSADIARACVVVFVKDLFTCLSFRFITKENLQRCGDVFFDILITSKAMC